LVIACAADSIVVRTLLGEDRKISSCLALGAAFAIILGACGGEDESDEAATSGTGGAASDKGGARTTGGAADTAGGAAPAGEGGASERRRCALGRQGGALQRSDRV
jgi:hypothetical protein